MTVLARGPALIFYIHAVLATSSRSLSDIESMANIASQRKRNERTLRERAENRRFVSSVKTHFRRLSKAVESGDASSIDAAHKELVSRIDKAVQKGALHRNTGARRKARAARIRASS